MCLTLPADEEEEIPLFEDEDVLELVANNLAQADKGQESLHRSVILSTGQGTYELVREAYAQSLVEALHREFDEPALGRGIDKDDQPQL